MKSEYITSGLKFGHQQRIVNWVKAGFDHSATSLQ